MQRKSHVAMKALTMKKNTERDSMGQNMIFREREERNRQILDLKEMISPIKQSTKKLKNAHKTDGFFGDFLKYELLGNRFRPPKVNKPVE